MSESETFDSRLKLLWGEEGLAQLRASCVLVLGVGGVGSNCIEALARGGVGHLVFVDFDTVQPSNINRQAVAWQRTLGRKKVEVMTEMIAEINPEAQVLAVDQFLKEADLPLLLQKVDAWLVDTAAQKQEQNMPCITYIIDALDTTSVKLGIAELAEQSKLPLISSMGAANKIHPENLKFADIFETKNCPLSRVVRKGLRKRGVESLQVLYSDEEPIEVPSGALGSASFMPPIMGEMLAGYVIRHIADKAKGELHD